MKKKLGILVLLFFSVSTASKANVFDAKSLETLIQSTIPNASIGIVVQDAKTGQLIYEKRSHELFPPASTTKLFTSAAALSSLGSDYAFVTAIKTQKASLKQNTTARGKIAKDLYVEFSGDPSLTDTDLKTLVSSIKTAGILEIEGNVFIDNHLFQKPDTALGWSSDSLVWYFAPPITTVILNENKVDFSVVSNQHIGGIATVTLPEHTIKVPIQSTLRTVTEIEAETQCQIFVDMDKQNQLQVSGCWPYQSTPTTLKAALKNPDYLAVQIIQEALKKEGIILHGKVLISSNDVTNIPQANTLEIIALHRSKPLKELIKVILQDSNNLYAESLTKTLGVKELQRGTFQSGVQAIKNTLKSTGIDFTNMKLYDGSGLSRYNLITPHQFAQLLYAVYHNEKIVDDFRNALSIVGEDGTLKDRIELKNYLAAQNAKIQAKTGSLQGVSTLSGYLKTNRDKDFIFVLMIDHAALDTKALKQFTDAFCRLLLNIN